MVNNYRFKKADLGKFADKNTQSISEKLEKNCRIIGLTMGEFSLIDLIHCILKETGPANVICTTWSAGIKDAHNVDWMKNTGLVNDFLLITDRSYKTRQKKYAVTLEKLFGVDNIRTSDVHAKFCLIYNNDYRYTIRTSMNLNANRTCESFEIDEGKEIFDFYKLFVDTTFEYTEKGFQTSRRAVNGPLSQFFDKKIEKWEIKPTFNHS